MGLIWLVIDFIREWKYNRDVEKSRQFTQATADGFWEVFYLATSFHGRRQLGAVVKAAKSEEVEVDPKILGMYEFVLATVPYQMYSVLN